MVQLSSLLPRILPWLPKASGLLVLQQLQDTVIDFYDRTRCFKAEATAQDIVANQPTYALVPPATNYVLVQVDDVKINRVPLKVASEEELDLNWESWRTSSSYHIWSQCSSGVSETDWRYASSTTARYFYVQNTDGALRLVGIPDAVYTGANGLVVTARWKPKVGVAEISDDIHDQYYQYLVAGCLGRMLMIPNKAWSNAKLAVLKMGEYEAGVGEASAQIKRNNKRDDRTVYRSVAVV